MSVYDESAFTDRVHYAKGCLLSGRTASDSFRACFEMKDGPLVTIRLMQMAESNPQLSRAIAHRKLGREFLRKDVYPIWRKLSPDLISRHAPYLRGLCDGNERAYLTTDSDS